MRENFLYGPFKKLAFTLDPERAHQWSMRLLSAFPSALARPFGGPELGEKYRLKLGKLSFAFPVGLAAGLDKNAQAVDFFTRLPFGAVEVGTVTLHPQKGNPRPRLFRYPREESLRNQMGFNNDGAERISQTLRQAKKRRARQDGQQNGQQNGQNEQVKKLLGVNIGKGKETPLESAWKDYQALYQIFAPLCDYLVINISSPNTSGLQKLQKAYAVEALLEPLRICRSRHPAPLFVKLSPDLDLETLPSLVKITRKYGLQGIIATNTMAMSERGSGGISGKLLFKRAHFLRQKLLELTGEDPDFHIIGVGGFSHFDQLWDFWKMGGRIIQLYTALIYQGPGLLISMRREIDRILEKNQISNLEEGLNNIKNLDR